MAYLNSVYATQPKWCPVKGAYKTTLYYEDGMVPEEVHAAYKEALTVLVNHCDNWNKLVLRSNGDSV